MFESLREKENSFEAILINDTFETTYSFKTCLQRFGTYCTAYVCLKLLQKLFILQNAFKMDRRVIA